VLAQQESNSILDAMLFVLALFFYPFEELIVFSNQLLILPHA